MADITNTTDSATASYAQGKWTIGSLAAGSAVSLTFTAPAGTSPTKNTARITRVDGATVAVSSNETSTASYTGSDVVITVNKDDAPWSGGPALTLVPEGGGEPLTDLNNTPDGTYYVYADGESTGKTVTVDHGESDPVTGEGLQLDYYTLTLVAGDGIDNVSGGGVYLEGSAVNIKAEAESGYGFDGWIASPDYTVAPDTADTAITMPGNALTLTANAQANDNIPYTVEHYVMEPGGSYTKAKTDQLTGSTGQTLILEQCKAASLEVPGGIAYRFGTVDDTEETTIQVESDGSLVIRLYYERMQYTLTLVAGRGVKSVSGGGTFYYGEEATVAAAVKSGYSWDGWRASPGGHPGVSGSRGTLAMPPCDLTLTANASRDDDRDSGPSTGAPNREPDPPARESQSVVVTEESASILAGQERPAGIEIHTPGVLPPLEATFTEEDAARQVIKEAAGDGKDVYAFDVGLILADTGASAQLKEGTTATVTLPLPDQYWQARDSVQVAALVNGELVPIPATLVEMDGGWHVVFSITQVGTYAIIADALMPLATFNPNTGR